MEIEEKAKNYAEGKAMSAITAAIEKAYIDGYESGYQDGIAKGEQPMEVIDGVEYVDLGLPSGTKWSSVIYKSKDGQVFFSHAEALKYNIPTLDQYVELIKYCKVIIRDSFKTVTVTDFLAPNGNMVTVTTSWYKQGNNTCKTNGFRFWLKGYAQTETNGLCATEKGKEESFKGNSFPIFLVH